MQIFVIRAAEIFFAVFDIASLEADSGFFAEIASPGQSIVPDMEPVAEIVDRAGFGIAHPAGDDVAVAFGILQSRLTDVFEFVHTGNAFGLLNRTVSQRQSYRRDRRTAENDDCQFNESEVFGLRFHNLHLSLI